MTPKLLALFENTPPADVDYTEGHMRNTFENWLTWIVLSLCGLLMLFGLIWGALG
jgi:hypothetical protein